jgi:hypothetical protein
MFSGGVDINVIKNEIDEASETGKVGGGIGRKEGDQIGTEIGPDVQGVDCRGNEHDLKKESLGGGSISTVLVKTENVEDDDDDDDDEEEEEEEDDSDENDDEEEEEEEEDEDDGNDNEMNDKRRKNLPCNSSETELGETKKFKEDMNEKPEVV